MSNITLPTDHPSKTKQSPTDDDCNTCPVRGKCASYCSHAYEEMKASGADRLGSTPGIRDVSQDLAGLIDHTLLYPDASQNDVRELCEEAREYKFASVCIYPTWVKACEGWLWDTNVNVCTVIGFPFGATTPDVKKLETRTSIQNGATEVDMVINISRMKSSDHQYVKNDIQGVVEEAGPSNTVKVILETAHLSEQEIRKACLIARDAGADFVKTSTGFGPHGARKEHVLIMRDTVGNKMGIKASGGIRDQEKAQEMVQAGATRIGASAGIKIVSGESSDEDNGY